MTVDEDGTITGVVDGAKVRLMLNEADNVGDRTTTGVVEGELAAVVEEDNGVLVDTDVLAAEAFGCHSISEKQVDTSQKYLDQEHSVPPEDLTATRSRSLRIASEAT